MSDPDDSEQDDRQQATGRTTSVPSAQSGPLHDMGGPVGPASIRGAGAPFEGGHGPEVVERHEREAGQGKSDRAVETAPLEEPDRDKGTKYGKYGTQPVTGPDEFHTATDPEAPGS
jgi:hypothetical protein